MLERKAYGKLLEWKRASNGTSALLIEGARRVGKSTAKSFQETSARSTCCTPGNSKRKANAFSYPYTWRFAFKPAAFAQPQQINP